jgi:acyl carrier protein
VAYTPIGITLALIFIGLPFVVRTVQPVLSDIETDAPLFGEGLGLDSIDALELGLALKKRYNIHLNAESDETKQHFKSIQSLVALVEAQQAV